MLDMLVFTGVKDSVFSTKLCANGFFCFFFAILEAQRIHGTGNICLVRNVQTLLLSISILLEKRPYTESKQIALQFGRVQLW